MDERTLRNEYIESRIRAASIRSAESLNYARSDIEKRLKSGEMLVAETIFRVNSNNYDLDTKALIVKAFHPKFFKEADNVNVKVNSATYNTEAFTILYDSNVLYWKPSKYDAGFDLEEGDLIEVEVFRKI